MIKSPSRSHLPISICQIANSLSHLLFNITEQDILQLRELAEAEILERTIPNKPNDPNQKYRRKQ